MKNGVLVKDFVCRGKVPLRNTSSVSLPCKLFLNTFVEVCVLKGKYEF